MWDRFQSRPQTPSNKPISLTLLSPTAAERGRLLLPSQGRLLWSRPAGLLEESYEPAQAPVFPVGTGTGLECVDWLPLGTGGDRFVLPCLWEGRFQCGRLNSTVCLSRSV